MCALVALPSIVWATPGADIAPAPYQAAPPRSVDARIIALRMQGDHAVITLAAGSDAGIAKDWRGVVLRGATEQPLASAEVTIIRLEARRTVARVKLTDAQLRANPRVRFSPPTE